MTTLQADELASALARDGATSVIQTMLGLAATSESNPDARVGLVMQSLEEMAEHRIDAACCLMLSLWPHASALMLHDVFDSINLWIWHNRSVAVINSLRRAAASEVDPTWKRHYEGFLLESNEA